MALKSDPIVVFDSGMGGISVLKEIVKLMPYEDFIYFGDSVNAPYGTKSVEEIRALTIGHIRHFIEEEHVKAVAVACNTATSAAVRTLREMYPDVPLVGVEPAVKPAVNACEHPVVIVMATPRTLAEPKFADLKQRFHENAVIYPVACAGLMEYVEQGILEGEELDSFLHDLLDPYLAMNPTGIVLGCTHYPFVRDMIAKVAGPDVTLYDGAGGTARELLRRLNEAGLSRETDHEGKVSFLNSSSDPERIALSWRLFNN